MVYALVHTPYTSNFPDAFAAAHGSICLGLSAVVWAQRDRGLASRTVMQAAVLVCAVAPWLTAAMLGLGYHVTPTTYTTALEATAALGSVAVLLDGRIGPLVWALVGELALWFLVGYLTNSTLELAALHAIWLGLLIGLHRAPPVRTERARFVLDEPHRGDWLVFVLATALATVTCFVVLERRIGSSDEWAYTYQAAVFAKLHAYAREPRCSNAFQNFWVYAYMGKQFSQYTPGWPYFMAPFVLARLPWLAGPTSFGLFAAGVARLARRAMSFAGDGTATSREIVAAGWFAALVTMLSSTLLINGGSRFAHVFVLTCYVWALEALLLLADPELRPTPRRARWWAIVLGVCCGLLLATRPLDGGGLGFGMFLYFVWAVAKRRFDVRTLVTIAIPFALLCGLTLVILRLQLGKWFTTGYSLTSMIHPWTKFAMSKPKPDEWRWGFPLATGSYVWWPCSLALGFAGLAALGRRARALNVMMFVGVTPVIFFYAFLDLGRGYDWGYGPRYRMIAMVPMALGTGVLLARLAYGRRSVAAFGALLAAIFLGVIRIAPLVYPYEYEAVANENRLGIAIQEAGVHHALVIATPGTGAVDPRDLTQNLPLELYPDQDVIIAVAHTPHLEQCVRNLYGDRAIYHATGRQQVVLTPER